MNKRYLSLVLAVFLLAGCAGAARAVDQSQALVSLSYLTGTFWNDLKATVRQDIDRDTAVIYSEVLGQASSSTGMASCTCGSDARLLGSVGSGLVWISGSAVVESGSLVDATAGAELPVGTALIGGHRYLAGSAVSLAAAAQSFWLWEGNWSVNSEEPVTTPAPIKTLPFIDVAENAWYRDDVSFVYEHGLFDGVSPESFNPSGKMQRCMMTTVLYRVAGKPAVSYTELFTDVPAGQWYSDGTAWAGAHGVVAGVGDGRFMPFSNVTRQEIAVILYRYAAASGLDVSQNASLSSFPDEGAAASWACDALRWAVGAGILNGDASGLRPTGDATRAEVSAMFHRFFNVYAL